MTIELNEGDIAPEFTLPTDEGSVSLAEFKGKPVVLYFYPKDDTTGCTVEAQDFSARKAAFESAGAAVIGVSKDTVKKHASFRKKYELTHALASDETGEMLERYGVWVEKSMYGRKYMGIERATFLIGADGRVRKAWRKVKVAGHAEDVLNAVQAG